MAFGQMRVDRVVGLEAFQRGFTAAFCPGLTENENPMAGSRIKSKLRHISHPERISRAIFLPPRLGNFSKFHYVGDWADVVSRKPFEKAVQGDGIGMNARGWGALSERCFPGGA